MAPLSQTKIALLYQDHLLEAAYPLKWVVAVVSVVVVVAVAAAFS
jgi:hypothetical protein